MARESSYAKHPVVIVWKTSNRSNAKTKIKVIKNKNIDEVLDPNIKLTGIPADAILLDIGVGEIFIQLYKDEYNL